MAIPKAESELVIWLNQFSRAMNTHGGALGFSVAEIAAVAADTAMLDHLISNVIPAAKHDLDARYAYKDLIKNGPLGAAGGNLPAPTLLEDVPLTVLPGVMPRLRQTIQRIRSAPGYTENIGRDFGITGDDRINAPETDTAKPTAKAEALPGHQVRIEFKKQRFDGVLIESRRTGETDWTQLGIDHYSPYLDSRPPATANQPETREYRLRYLSHDEAVGDWSDILSVTTRA